MLVSLDNLLASFLSGAFGVSIYESGRRCLELRRIFVLNFGFGMFCNSKGW